MTGLRVRGRQDCCHTRTANYAIHVGNDLTAAGRLQNNAVCVPAVAGRALTQYSADNLVCQQPIYGRIVIFSLVVPIAAVPLTLCEVEIWSPECAPCPADSTSVPGSTGRSDCQCNAGYTGANGGTCSQCNINHYKAGLGPAACTPCLADSVSAAGSVVNTACQCNAGYTGAHGGTCVRCLAGTYKSGTGNADCVGCPSNSFSPTGSTAVTACVCNGGFAFGGGVQTHI